jgi:hypothetical protein
MLERQPRPGFRGREPKIHVGLHAAVRLKELGTDEAEILDAVAYALHGWAQCTANDPPNFPGMVMWARTTRGLRDRMNPRGWRNTNARNFARVVHPSRTHALAVAGGDPSTGKEDETPWTRREKGPATLHAVAMNVQRNFGLISREWSDLMRAAEDVEIDLPDQETWFVLHYIDEENDEVRVEVSLPGTMNTNGYITDWLERIILTTQPLTPRAIESSSDGDGDEDGEIVVPVERKDVSA